MGEPASTSCALWLPKKRRYCNFAPVTGFSYCGHHLASRGDTQGAKGQERIPCPLDGRHSIFAKDLQRHLKVCPRAKEIALQESQPYFQRDANRGDELEPAPRSATAVKRRRRNKRLDFLLLVFSRRLFSGFQLRLRF